MDKAKKALTASREHVLSRQCPIFKTTCSPKCASYFAGRVQEARVPRVIEAECTCALVTGVIVHDEG